MDDSFYMDDFYIGSFHEEAKLAVKKLALECPKKGPLPDCPLSIFRGLPYNDKLEMIELLTQDQLDAIIQHHDSCFQVSKY